MSYYRGDPGFFDIFKSIGSAAVSMIPGVGGAASRAIQAIPSPIKKAAISTGGAIMKHPVLSAAGGAAAASAVAAGAAGRGGLFGRPAGKHPSRRHLHALAMGLKRARPRMNPTNIHALRRAARRAHAFLRISRKLVAYYTPRHKKGRPYIKHKKRSK